MCRAFHTCGLPPGCLVQQASVHLTSLGLCHCALQAAKAGLDGAEQSLAATRSAEATSNATLAITEASNTAWRARQTAQAQSAAEQQAMGASEAAGQSRSVRAYNAELAAAQSYNLVGFAGSPARDQLIPC